MRVDLAGQRLSFPPQCACCEKSADGVYVASSTRYRGKRSVTSTTREWSFPICSHCRAHISTYNSSATAAAVLFVVAIVLAFPFGVLGFAIGTAVTMAGFLYLRYRAETARASECASAGPPATFIGWYGSVQMFEISSASYASGFLAANSRKAVNLTNESRAALLDGLSSATSMRVQSTVVDGNQATKTDEELLAHWIPKIEAQRGASGRRAVIARAIQEAIRPEGLNKSVRLEFFSYLASDHKQNH